jgi:hypothetical protein
MNEVSENKIGTADAEAAIAVSQNEGVDAGATAGAVAADNGKRRKPFAIVSLVLSVIVLALLVTMLIMMLTDRIVWNSPEPLMKSNTFSVLSYQDVDAQGEAKINELLREQVAGADNYLKFRTDYKYVTVSIDKYNGPTVATNYSTALFASDDFTEYDSKGNYTGYILWGNAGADGESGLAGPSFISVMTANDSATSICSANNDGEGYEPLDATGGSIWGNLYDGDSAGNIVENRKYAIYAWTAYKGATIQAPTEPLEFPTDSESYVLSATFSNDEPELA